MHYHAMDTRGGRALRDATFGDLSLGSVDVIDGRQQLLTGLLVDVRAQADVDQVGQLLHGVLLRETETR